MGIRVINGGFLTTVQDLGRYGFQETGMAVSGVMDTRAASLANILVGNGRNEAVLEITMMGPTLEFTAGNIVALAGADLGAKLDHQPFPLYEAVLVHAGQTLSFSGMFSGSRAYLACSGGFDVPVIMGSKSTNLKAKLGGYEGRKLAAEDELKFAAPKVSLPNMGKRKLDQAGGGVPEICTLRVVMGPQDNCFTERGISTFLNSAYTITNEYDRMGCRMEGEKIEHKNGGDIITDGISFGAVQIPSHGQPIVMMADHQTTGGYTKIACVISADLPLLAQCRPGTKIRFQKIELEEAQELLYQQHEQFDQLEKKLNIKIQGTVTGKSHRATTYCVVLNGKEYVVELERESPRFR